MDCKILLKRTTYEDALVYDGILTKDEVIFEYPRDGNTGGALKSGDGFSQYHELPYVLEPGHGPTTPDAVLGIAQMLAAAYKIQKEILCSRTV